jgi:hypothetical protein
VYVSPAVGKRLTFKFNKRAENFVSADNETPSVAAMCVNNSDRSPFRIHG